MLGFTLPPGPLTVLCLGAHPDDVEIGCGGTLLGLARSRALTAHVFLLTGSAERQAEAHDAAAAFCPGAMVTVEIAGLPDGRLPAHWNDAKDALEAVGRKIRPDLIFSPRADDSHQDHRVLAELVTTVWRDALVLQYEIPKWDGDLGKVTHYVALPEETALNKVALLNKCYPSQLARDWWTDDTFLSLMRLRGIESRSRYAEGFTIAKALVTLVSGSGTADPAAG